MPQYYFDSFVVLGQREHKDPAHPWTTDFVLEEMRHCGVHAALCYQNVAMRYDCEFGNQRLMNSDLPKSPRLIGSWVLLPHHTSEMDAPARLIERMREANIRAVNIFPKSHHYSLRPWVIGPLLDAVQQERILLSIHIDELPGFDAVDDLCSQFPRLPILLRHCGWADNRYVWPLMARHENLHLEFSTFQVNGVIEIMCREFGAERLLFGSETPVKSLGAARAFIDYSDITEEQKDLIAYRNLQRLLGGVELMDYDTPAEDEPILALAKEGKPLTEYVVIDSHTHLCHPGAQGTGLIPMPESDAVHMVKKNRRIGIRKMCTSAWLSIFVPDDAGGNDITAAAIREFPDEIIGYACIDPTHRKDIEPEIHRCYFELGMKGVKPYVQNGLPFDHDLYTPWWEFANAHHLFALIHGNEGPVVKLSEKYPEVTFLLAHRGGSYPSAREGIALIRDRDNVLIEITYTPVPQDIIEFIVSEVGADKIVFGTDSPMRDPRPQFGWTVYSKLSTEEKRKILGENMQKVLARVKLEPTVE